MVGLSVVLETEAPHGLKASCGATTPTPTLSTKTTSKVTVLPLVVVNKATMLAKPPPGPPLSPLPGFARDFDFLDACLLCREKLLPGKDIYMYKGDRAYCSEECRGKQMLMEEEDKKKANNSKRKERGSNNCSLAAMKPISTAAAASPAERPHRRAAKAPTATGGFAR